MQITYLLNSGFMIKSQNTILVFDDYADPKKNVYRAAEGGDYAAIYIFASHAHFDHFDTHIIDHASHATKYIFAQEIKKTKRGKTFPEDKTVFLADYSSWEDEHISAETFSSTDTGTSFLVTIKGEGGERIFHAGDFNWWHWSGDTAENIALAKNGFMQQMKTLEGLAAEAAFFPIDGRLGEYYDIGAKFFCAHTDVKAIVAMHSVGYPAWTPSADFFAPGREIPHWSPTEPGETINLTGGNFSL